MLHELVDRMQASGLDIALDVTGTPAPLPAGLDLSAYRIIQEALTNTLKHAGPTRTRVTLDFAETLSLDVVDDGPAPGQRRSRGSGGHGLVGMRERATLFDGSLTAGPDGNGWRVHATIPRPIGHTVETTTTGA
jgi:signal transduction histidine kinase